MLNELLLHQRTKIQTEKFLKSPVHGLILTGDKGVGKRTVAQAIAAELLNLHTVDELNNYPYFTLVDPTETVITIEQIRELQKLLTLKTPKGRQAEIRRVIIIVDAERMRGEAQNAFLKSLEEPPADTSLILTTEGSNKLLPTVYSRAQRIDVLPVSESAAQEYFNERGVSSKQFNASYALSQGQPGLLSALLYESEHELLAWVNTAKELLSKPMSERLLATDGLSKDKLGITLLLNALQRITHAALINAGTANKNEAVRRWSESSAAVQSAIKSLSANANSKLMLDDLFLNL